MLAQWSACHIGTNMPMRLCANIPQAPAGGGPFIVSGERLPDMVASLNQVSNVCRAVANTCIAVGGVLIAVKAAQGALLLWRRHKHRCACALKVVIIHCSTYRQLHQRVH